MASRKLPRAFLWLAATSLVLVFIGQLMVLNAKIEMLMHLQPGMTEAEVRQYLHVPASRKVWEAGQMREAGRSGTGPGRIYFLNVDSWRLLPWYTMPNFTIAMDSDRKVVAVIYD
jgi:hypothetical protein